jgi:hypothetical protein
MANRTRASKVMHMYKLDTKPYANLTRKMQRLVDKALGQYGESKMSLIELRETVDRQLGGISLSEMIIKERQAGW